MLGPLESEVLLALSALSEAPARAVREELDRRGIDVAYTTVATILARLHQKGMVRRRREACRGGERFVYRAADFERRYLRSLLEGVVELFGPVGVVHLNEELARKGPGGGRQGRRRLKLRAGSP